MDTHLVSSPIASVAFVILMAGSCARSRPAADVVGAITPTAGAARTCPLGVNGAKVAVVDAADGVDVSFTTGGDVDELRRRVRDQAAEHGPGAHAGLGHGGSHIGAQVHGLRLWEIGQVAASASDIEGGARLHVVPTNPADTVRVRAALHDRAAYIVALGDCP